MTFGSKFEKIASFGTRFVKDEKGASAVEFAMVLPFLTALYFMFVGLAGGNNTASKVGQVASTVSDIISQSPSLTAAQVDLALQAGDAIAGTTNTANMQIEVVGVQVKNNGSTEVVWSRSANGGTPYAAGSSYDIPVSLRSQPGFIVASRTALGYVPVVGASVLPDGNIPLESKYYFVPRASTETFCPDC